MSVYTFKGKSLGRCEETRRCEDVAARGAGPRASEVPFLESLEGKQKINDKNGFG